MLKYYTKCIQNRAKCHEPNHFKRTLLVKSFVGYLKIYATHIPFEERIAFPE